MKKYSSWFLIVMVCQVLAMPNPESQRGSSKYQDSFIVQESPRLRNGRQNIQIMNPNIDDVEIIDVEELDPAGFIPERKPQPKPEIPLPSPPEFEPEDPLENPPKRRPVPPPPKEPSPGLVGSLFSASRRVVMPNRKRRAGIMQMIGNMFTDSSRPRKTTPAEGKSRQRRQTQQIIDNVRKVLEEARKRPAVKVQFSLDGDSAEKDSDGGKNAAQEITSEEEEEEAQASEEEAEQSEEAQGSDESSSEEDEPPGGGDGAGGGILGILSGLSGGEGGSDLGTLLTVVGTIVSNLSGGEGFDLNVLIGSAVALFAGISAGDGTRNIGSQIAAYYVTSLDGFTGGGAANNGDFLGNFLASLSAGVSAAENENSEEEGEPQKDSGTFLMSFLSAIFGGMSAGLSSSSSSSQ